MAGNGDDLFGFDDNFDLNTGSGQGLDLDSAFGSEANDEEDDGFGDLGNKQEYDRKSTKKTALVAIICGIVLVVVVFGIVRFINREPKVKEPSGNNDNIPAIVSPKPEDTNQTSQVPVNNQNNGNNPNNDTNVSDWVEIPEYGNITWSEKLVNTSFSVTSKKHYLKVIDGSNFEIKTVLYGALAGFTGTYELEVPYTIGTHKDLVIGESFNVTVQVGTDISGKTVIGSINY